jgi:cellulose synthase/poly-beta-1,6-N-acetylglucosamine synthase-like glycosyltransferase
MTAATRIPDKKKYVLITAARNEEKYIENTIKAVIAQTVLPVKWIIVSDGSTDRTDEIVLQYSARHSFIHLVSKTANINGQVDFSSKVHAIKMGYERLAGIDYDLIGILDGDVTFNFRYYENILIKFSENSKLGIAGGIILDQYDDHCIRRSPSNSNYVSGCIQLFRRKCYEDIGGLFPIKEGGEDTIAVIKGQMKGWEVEAFEKIEVYHHKHSKATGDKLKEAFRAGRMFYALGSHPLSEVLKSIKSITAEPYLLFAMTRMCGYLIPYFKRQRRPVTEEFIQFLRKEQLSKFKLILFK